MRSLRYLNVMLTLVAVLLAGNLWVAVQDSPGNWRAVSEAHAAGLANAGAQRQQIIDQLKKVNVQLGDLKTMLKKGDVAVQVSRKQSAKDED